VSYERSLVLIRNSTFQHGCYTLVVLEKDAADLIAFLEENGLEVYSMRQV
jgi:hypothetical protein